MKKQVSITCPAKTPEIRTLSAYRQVAQSDDAILTRVINKPPLWPIHWKPLRDCIATQTRWCSTENVCLQNALVHVAALSKGLHIVAHIVHSFNCSPTRRNTGITK